MLCNKWLFFSIKSFRKLKKVLTNKSLCIILCLFVTCTLFGRGGSKMTLKQAIRKARDVYFQVQGTECFISATKKEALRIVGHEVEFGWEYMDWGDGDILIEQGYGY